MQLNCENDLCIYQNKNKCLLGQVTVDASGMCGECLLVDFEKELLCHRKAAMRAAFEQTAGPL